MFVCAVLLPGGALSVGVCGHVYVCYFVCMCACVCMCGDCSGRLCVCVCVRAERELRFTGARTASHE